eukprot:SAG22_NODE_317_length_12513_cov_41.467214_13_plen_215_part_00
MLCSALRCSLGLKRPARAQALAEAALGMFLALLAMADAGLLAEPVQDRCYAAFFAPHALELLAVAQLERTAAGQSIRRHVQQAFAAYLRQPRFSARTAEWVWALHVASAEEETWKANRPEHQGDFVGGLLAVLARGGDGGDGDGDGGARRGWLAAKHDVAAYLRLLRLPVAPPVSVLQWCLGEIAGLMADEAQRTTFLNNKGALCCLPVHPSGS